MYKNTCKLCLFKCDPDDEGLDLCEDIQELRKIVKEIFHNRVLLIINSFLIHC